jgi:hypothetical protein
MKRVENIVDYLVHYIGIISELHRNEVVRSGNACHHSVQNLLSSSLLSRHLNVKIHRTVIVSAVLYGC